eukprot:UN08685
MTNLILENSFVIDVKIKHLQVYYAQNISRKTLQTLKKANHFSYLTSHIFVRNSNFRHVHITIQLTSRAPPHSNTGRERRWIECP